MDPTLQPAAAAGISDSEHEIRKKWSLENVGGGALASGISESENPSVLNYDSTGKSLSISATYDATGKSMSISALSGVDPMLRPPSQRIAVPLATGVLFVLACLYIFLVSLCSVCFVCLVFL